MKLLNALKKATDWALHYLQLQLFITLVSLPILVAWGLPISLLSPLGNLIFSPVLTLFLFLSSLIFFTQLFSIPNQPLIYLLELLSEWWIYFMHADTKTWLLGFPQPAWWLLLAIPLVSLFMLIHPKTRSRNRCIGLFTLMLVGFGLWGRLAIPGTIITSIACNNGTVPIIVHHNQVIIIDPGYIGQRSSGPSWTQYTLMPALAQASGKTTIDHLILLQPSTLLFQAIEHLATVASIGTVYLVCWQGTFDTTTLKRFFSFKRTLEQKKIALVRLAQSPYTIPLRKEQSISISPLDQHIPYQDGSFPAYAVTGQIDNHPITFYSAKYKTKNSKLSAQHNDNLLT